MKKYKNLLFVICYKDTSKFYNNYINALENQSNKNFDILILYDNFKKKILIPDSFNSTHIFINKNISKNEIRLMGINYSILKKYKNIIFSDIYDYFSKKRIHESIYNLSKYDFVYNEIDSVNFKNKILERNIIQNANKNFYLNSLKYIMDINMLGLTNTAIKVSTLKKFYIPKKIIAIDWWIFSYLLINNKKGYFINNCKSFYMQHNNNLIGTNNKLDDKRLTLIFKVKLNHYFELLRLARKLKKNKLELLIHDFYYKLSYFRKKMYNQDKRNIFIDNFNINRNNKFQGWWSEVQLKDYE